MDGLAEEEVGGGDSVAEQRETWRRQGGKWKTMSVCGRRRGECVVWRFWRGGEDGDGFGFGFGFESGVQWQLHFLGLASFGFPPKYLKFRYLVARGFVATGKTSFENAK